ncbi:Potassium efflux system KefA protein / Small-conductance mechanosensitive channel [hydrothermal vent metagenome]|uniref:Potassium efflux system KefA protein / Small-conductance mechanosensitive channel n=1 Tax=hydrothermal vent metagenome TaxID=652676 RepID=A0A3B0V324_9ZZZZ
MNEVLLEIGEAILIIAVAWLLSWASRYFLTQVVKRLIARTNTQLDDVILQAVDYSFRAAILVGGIEFALLRLSFMSEAWLNSLDRLFFVLYSLLIFIFLYRLIGGLVRWYGAEVAHKTETDIDDKFLGLFRRLAHIVLMMTLFVIILGRFGIEVSALVTTLGIGSLAIALAAQETLGDMFSGFTIMMDRPFAIGDRVELLDLDTWGDVTDIGLRSTRILTRDNRSVTVPNSVIGKGLIVNYSTPSTRYRVQTHVGVAYGTDIELARDVMIEAIRQQDWVMKDERIEALFLEFGDSSLNFRVRCWIEHYVETRRIIDKMNSALYHALNENKIGIPFPQRDIRIIESTEKG